MKIYKVVILLLSGMIYASEEENENHFPLSFCIAELYLSKEKKDDF